MSYPTLEDVEDTPTSELKNLLAETEEAISYMELQVSVRQRLQTATPEWLNSVSTAVFYAELSKQAILKRMENVPRSPSA